MAIALLLTGCASGPGSPEIGVRERRAASGAGGAAEAAGLIKDAPRVVRVTDFGFDSENATPYFQAAIDSGAGVVIVPDVGRPWNVRPVELRSNQEIVFEPGAVVQALRGAFVKTDRVLFTARDVENLTLRGYGAELRMWKEDYQGPEYEPSQWRHMISLLGAKNVKILGLTLKSSGGDGIYVGRGAVPYSQNVLIRDVTATDHHRQAISVVSGDHVVIDHCELTSTAGTLPEAGIDFEPNRADERLSDISVSNTYIARNHGAGIMVQIRRFDATSKPVSIRVENSEIEGNKLGLLVMGAHHGGRGDVVFTNTRLRGLRLVRRSDVFDVTYR